MTYPLARWDDEYVGVSRPCVGSRISSVLIVLFSPWSTGSTRIQNCLNSRRLASCSRNWSSRIRLIRRTSWWLPARRSLRDRIRRGAPRGFACVPWEGRHDGDIGCETVYRVKGLERDAVILATAHDNLSDHLLYVGMSRAISRLVVIGPKALSERLAGRVASVCRN